MTKRLIKNVAYWLIAATAAVGTSVAVAQASQKPDAKELEKIKSAISAQLEKGKPGIRVVDVQPSQIPGLFKTTFPDGPHIYTTADGKYFISGDIYEVMAGKIVNLTDAEKDGDRKAAMAALDKKDMIVFPPKNGKPKEVLYVFTDVDCGYCQLLHSKVGEYNEMGIEIRYLAYPRAGVNSNSYKKMASAWCAEDTQDALTKLKNREEIPENICEGNPVADQFDLSRQLGLTGTPALITESGQLISGYLEPGRLKEALSL